LAVSLDSLLLKHPPFSLENVFHARDSKPGLSLTCATGPGPRATYPSPPSLPPLLALWAPAPAAKAAALRCWHWPHRLKHHMYRSCI